MPAWPGPHSCCAYCFHLARETCLCLPEGKCFVHPNAGTTTRNPHGDLYISKCGTCKSEIHVGLEMWLSSDELSVHTTAQTRNPTGTQSVPAFRHSGSCQDCHSFQTILDHTVRACLKNTKLKS